MIVVNPVIWLKESSQVTSSLLKLQPFLKPVLLKLLVTSSIVSKTRKILLMQSEHAVLKHIRIQAQEEKT